MNDRFRRKLGTLTGVRDFQASHSTLFPAPSRVATLSTRLSEVITELQTLAAAQVSSTAASREVTTLKSIARANLIDDLEAISMTTRSLAVTKPSLENKFRLPRRVSDQVLLATARSFAKDAEPLKADFIDFGLPADFIDDLKADIAELEAALTERHATNDSKSAATVRMDALLEEGFSIVQQLQAPVQNKIKHDDGLMIAWRRASRTERARRSARGSAPAAGGDEDPEEPPTGGTGGA